MTLNDLDEDDNVTTVDSVNVTIEAVGTDSYKAISEGTYGASKRKIEAIFEMTETTGAGSRPAFYSRSDVMLEERVTINGVSLFSESNIVIKDLENPLNRRDFQRSYQEENTGMSKDVLKINDPFTCVKDELGNCVKDELGDWEVSPWNTVGRRGITPYPLWSTTAPPYTPSSTPFEGVGFAAEGKICGSSSCQSDSPSVADGVYGYDSTTGAKGNNLKFAEKINCTTLVTEPANPNIETTCPPSPQNLITYPFERIEPDAYQLKQSAVASGTYYFGDPPKEWWTAKFNTSSVASPKVIFVDGKGTGVALKDISVDAYGILVVWCGKLTLDEPFKGVIVNLRGNSSELPGGGSSCSNSTSGVGGFVNEGEKITGYAYAEGDLGGVSGIYLKKDSVLNPLTGPGRDELLGYAFGEGAPTSVETKLTSWRELYE